MASKNFSKTMSATATEALAASKIGAEYVVEIQADINNAGDGVIKDGAGVTIMQLTAGQREPHYVDKARVPDLANSLLGDCVDLSTWTVTSTIDDKFYVNAS